MNLEEEGLLFDPAENAHLFSVHFVYCRGCQRRWLDPPPAPHVDCACTCSDPEDPLYEAWVVDPFMDEQSTTACCPRQTIPDSCSCLEGCGCMCLDCICGNWGEEYEDD